MNSSFSPRTVITLILPGAIFLMALSFILIKEDVWHQIATFTTSATSTLVSASFVTAFLLAAFFLGSLFDSIRNLLDSFIDRNLLKDGCNWWDIFFKGEKEKVEQMDGYYFSYYQFDANAAIASFILAAILVCLGQFWLGTIPVAVCAILFADALSLRKEIKRLAQEYLLSSPNDALPHENVNARLQPSTVCDGVGVFAIKSIKKGALVFPDDNGDMVWISKTKLEGANLSNANKKLYNDFAVFTSDQCGCPSSFDNLTVAWYLNEPGKDQEPNVKCNISDGYKFYAARDINKGEELTARYSEYSLDSWL